MKTRDQARAELKSKLHTAASWARLHGFKASAVRRVLNNNSVGYWGESRLIAIKLGLISSEQEEKANDHG